jgi:DNA-binding CsgD family transcriptional regulator
MTESVKIILLVALFAVPVLLAYRSFLVYKDRLTLVRDLDAARLQGRQWRDETRSLLRGLGEAIDRQFLTWKLTEAERDVGLLILKGLSLREIAAARVTSERTIRAQARSIYAKAGLSGRAALSAFFLEDLLAPIGQLDWSHGASGRAHHADG